MIDVASLQLDDAPRDGDRRRRDAVGADAVYDAAVALFPQAMAELFGRPHERPIVELVEIPFVE